MSTDTRHECVCTASGYHLPTPNNCTQQDETIGGVMYRTWRSKNGYLLRGELLETALARGLDIHKMAHCQLMLK